MSNNLEKYVVSIDGILEDAVKFVSEVISQGAQ